MGKTLATSVKREVGSGTYMTSMFVVHTHADGIIYQIGKLSSDWHDRSELRVVRLPEKKRGWDSECERVPRVLLT